MNVIDNDQLFNKLGIAHFQSCSTLGALSDDAIRWLLKQGKLLRYEPNETIFSPGDSADGFFVVLQGSVDFYKEGVFIKKHEQGEQLGAPSMVALQPRSGTAKAHEQSIVLYLSSDNFFQLHETLPTDFGIILLNLTREIARKLKIVSQALAESENQLSELKRNKKQC